MKKILVAFLTLIGVHKRLTAEQKSDLVHAGVQLSPGAVASAVSQAWGMTPADLVAYATVVFVALQAGYLVWKWRNDYEVNRERRADRDKLAAHTKSTVESDTDMGAL